MLKKFISKISDSFIEEALNSPRLLEDMASMEKYMAESYNGRIFIELLQNADDACSNKIYISDLEGSIIFANNGRKFNEDDIIAISRSGASNKERGKTIGYRGIGFKSTTYLTDEIIIYSDETFFSFSKTLCANLLKTPKEKIPTVRIPILIDDIEVSLYNKVTELINQGYTTVFIFKNSKIDDFVEELKKITVGYFLFLNNITKCEIKMSSFNTQFEINREKRNEEIFISINGESSYSWINVLGTTSSIAFKCDKDGTIVQSRPEESIYHCFLPTLERVSFSAKINGDFTTEPSRNHITYDEKTLEILLSVANNMCAIVSKILNNNAPIYYNNILNIFMENSSFSKVNSILRENFNKLINNSVWLQLNNGTRIKVNEYKQLPDWLEDSEKNFIRIQSDIVKSQSLEEKLYKNIVGIEKFLGQYSQLIYTFSELVSIMEDNSFVKLLNPRTQGKILAKIIKYCKSNKYISVESINLSNVRILTDLGVFTIKEIGSNSLKVNTHVTEALNEFLNENELEWFIKETNVNIKKNVVLEKTENYISINKKEKTQSPNISKWRSAEQQCIQLEEYFGNKAKDVSKQNVGYDIESVTPTGEVRYIEVKSISKGEEFTITNNEYTSAHQYGSCYYICLIFQDELNLNVTYIKNPLNSAQFEKRIRQWEWLCTGYSGQEFKFEL